MTDRIETLTDFAALRRAGIAYVQEASGEIWTDYNVHDPGVTLLEQTCFALSQIAYQAGLPMRDLLTEPNRRFRTRSLALFGPLKVLATNPVTRRDLAALICECRGVDSVSIRPMDRGDPHRYHVTLVPSEQGLQEKDPEAAFRAAFAAMRPLCTALGTVEIARAVDVILFGKVEIGPEALPETVAAALYHRVAQILTGAERTDGPATRADVWDAPERLLSPPQSRSEQALDVSRHLARLRALPGVRGITQLTLKRRGLKAPDPDHPDYFRVVIPKTDAQIEVTLTLNGAAVTLSAARLREEYIRISAEAIAEAHHHIDMPDWNVMTPGRSRRFDHGDVDSLLPVLYRDPHPGQGAGDGGALFRQYRGAIDAVLRDMVGTLNTTPQRFTPHASAAETDPVLHRTRITLLDYLIALQGSEMPATRHSGLHCYMTTTARHRFEIDWRLRYLFALPVLHRARATGPGPRGPGGFLAELAILCDLDLARPGDATSVLKDYALTLDPGATLATDPEAGDLMLIPAFNPFDMLVPESDGAEPFSPEELAGFLHFLDGGALSPALLSRLSQGDSFAMAPHAGGHWLILLDAGPDHKLLRIGVTANKTEAAEAVVRLRATWRHLNRACETMRLVEHITLDAEARTAPPVADLVLPGWTARCAMQSYRSFVEARVEDLAPAHVHVRVHWLSPKAMTDFEAARAAATDEMAKRALRTLLDSFAAGEES